MLSLSFSLVRFSSAFGNARRGLYYHEREVAFIFHLHPVLALFSLSLFLSGKICRLEALENYLKTPSLQA